MGVRAVDLATLGMKVRGGSFGATVTQNSKTRVTQVGPCSNRFNIQVDVSLSLSPLATEDPPSPGRHMPSASAFVTCWIFAIGM